MESPLSFSENSMLTLDSLTRSSWTVVPSLLQTLQKYLVVSLDMKSPYLQHIILKLMEKWKGSTKRSRPTSASSAVLTLRHGLTTFPWLSLSTTTALTLPPANPHFTSCSDTNHKPSPASLKPPTFQLWKNTLETLTHHERKHLPHTNSHNNS